MKMANWKRSPFVENIPLRVVTYYAVFGTLA